MTQVKYTPTRFDDEFKISRFLRLTTIEEAQQETIYELVALISPTEANTISRHTAILVRDTYYRLFNASFESSGTGLVCIRARMHYLRDHLFDPIHDDLIKGPAKW